MCGTYRGVRDVFDARARPRFEGPVSVSFTFFARREGNWRVGDVYWRMPPEGGGLFHWISLCRLIRTLVRTMGLPPGWGGGLSVEDVAEFGGCDKPELDDWERFLAGEALQE